METPQDPYPTTARRLVHGFLGVIGVCALYALSIGPVEVRYYRRDFGSAFNRRAFYHPLREFVRITHTENQLRSYMGWWFVAFQPVDGYEAGRGRYKFDSSGSLIYLPTDTDSKPPRERDLSKLKFTIDESGNAILVPSPEEPAPRNQ